MGINMKKEDLDIIKKTVEDFFSKMTVSVYSIEINPTSIDLDDILKESNDNKSDNLVDLVIKSSDSGILIGEKGQTLISIQKLLRMIFSKKMKKDFHFNLDINDYKKKRSETLKKIAKEALEDVIFYKKEKALQPMSSFERRIIHAELAQKQGIKTESRGVGEDRYIVVIPV